MAWTPGRRKADHRVARRDIGTRQQRTAFGSTDGEAGKVVIAVPVQAGHLGGLAADQRAAGFPAGFRHTRNDGGRSFGIEFAAGKIVEKEQRLGALHHEIIDRHRHQVDADAAVQAGLDRDLDLGTDAVGRSNQHRIDKARGLQIEQSAKSADFSVCTRPRGGTYHRLDQVDQTVAGIDVDAGIRVGQPVFAVDHAQFQMMVARYVGIRQRAMARKPPELVLCRRKPAPSQSRIIREIGPAGSTA